MENHCAICALAGSLVKARLLVLFLPFIFAIHLSGQNAPALPPDGGGAYQVDSGPCLSAVQRAEIAAGLVANTAALAREGKLPPVSRSVVQFDWPVQMAPGLGWNNFYTVNNFVDHELVAGVREYECGQRTYDGHLGIDIDLWPYPWYQKENNLARVVAAAPGVIIGKEDGNQDESCSWGNGGAWNAIYIRHADGSAAWYGHLKRNSLTAKPVGASVAKGEYLGIVASSGYSTWPHLHFEVYRAEPYVYDNLIDPYWGECNFTNFESWWADQQPYRQPTVNAVLTHNAPPEIGCVQDENPYFSDYFTPGDMAYAAVYFRDQLQGMVSTLRIRTPNGAIWNEWTHISPEDYTSSWWYWGIGLPTSGPFGTWSFEVTFNNETHAHFFEYESLVSTASVEASPVAVFPNPARETLSIQGLQERPVIVEIYSAAGQLLFRQEAGEEGIRLSGLAPGMYLVKIMAGEAVYTSRVVKAD